LTEITKDIQKLFGKKIDVYNMDDEKNNPYQVKEFISTGCYILNALLCAGDIYGGMPKGKRVMFGGPSSTGKSLLTAYVAKNYLEEKPETHLVAFETEGASFYDMMKSIDIDEKRVTIVPTNTVEQFRTLITKLLAHIAEQKEKGVHKEYIFLLDSMGMLATTKETTDAMEGSSKADMTRAKLLRSLFRIISLDLFRLQIPFLIVNHTYETMDMYSGPVVSGGGGPTYAADVIITLTKAKSKEGTAHIGAILSLNIQKSRYMPEGARGKVLVLFKKGIQKHSYLLDMGREVGLITKEGISYILNDIKMKRTDIMREPEKFFTKAGLDLLREEIKKIWSFGESGEDVDINDLIEDEDENEDE